MGLLENIANSFDLEPSRPTTHGDIGLLNRRLGGKNLFGGSSAYTSTAVEAPHGNGVFELQPGMVFVHGKRAQDPLPQFMTSLPRSGISSIDTSFHLKSEQLLRDMQREFSDFSVSGLEWAEARSREDAAVQAERAAEDAALARRRFEEDAAIAAKRAHADESRASHNGVHNTRFIASREEEEASLMARWRSKFAQLGASLDEAIADYDKQRALDEQRAKEEEARVQEAAAREAEREAMRLRGQVEMAEDARRLAELARLRLAVEPSVRSLALVTADQIAPALAYACPVGTGQPLRKTDRTWWKALHILEAEGLTPPLKAHALSSKLFDACDIDDDGAVATIDSGYLLALLASGSLRDRVDAACDAPGAAAGSPSVTPRAATSLLLRVAHARKLCGPRLVGLLTDTPAADAATTVPVPSDESIERAVASFFVGAGSGAREEPIEHIHTTRTHGRTHKSTR